MFFFQYKLLVNCVIWEPFVFQRDGFAVIVLNISFFDATEEGGTFLSEEQIFFDFPSFFPYDKT